MLNEEKFKQVLNDKLAEEQFPFDASNWPGAEALLDADKKRRGGFFYLIPLLLLIGGIATYLWWPNQNTAPKARVKTLAKIESAEVKELTPTASEAAQPALQLTIRPESPKQSNNVTNTKAKQTFTKEIETVDVPETNKTTKASVPEVNVEAPVKQMESIREPLATGPQVTVSDLPTNVNQAIQNILPAAVAETPTIAAVNTGLSSVNPTAANEKVQIKEEKSKTTETLTMALAETTTMLKPEMEVKTNTVTNVPVVLNQEKPKQDSVQNQAAAIENFTAAPTAFLWLDIGTAYNLAYQHTGAKEGNGLNPSFGIHFMSVIKDKYAFSFGLQYQSVRGLHLSNHVSKVTRYGLGEDNFVTVISPSTLHYLYLPLRLSYTYREKNVFGLGYQVGYMFNVDSKVETYNEHFNTVDNYQTYRTGGYTEGFAMFDHQLALAYRRKLYKDFWVNAEAYFGLVDVKNDVFFASKVFERNRGLKISLMYQVFKK